MDCAGNDFIAVVVGILGTVFSQQALFLVLPVFAGLTIVAVLTIPARIIDHDRARGLAAEDSGFSRHPESWRVLLRSRAYEPPQLPHLLSAITKRQTNRYLRASGVKRIKQKEISAVRLPAQSRSPVLFRRSGASRQRTSPRPTRKRPLRPVTRRFRSKDTTTMNSRAMLRGLNIRCASFVADVAAGVLRVTRIEHYHFERPTLKLCDRPADPIANSIPLDHIAIDDR
jgi:hypothetical protein